MAGLSAYKPGQGYWTRVISAVAAATLVLAGIAWLLRTMEAWDVWRVEAPEQITITVDQDALGLDPVSAVAAFGIQNPEVYAPDAPIPEGDQAVDLSAYSRGVEVGRIRAGSPVASVNMTRGQVITAVNSQAVRTEAELAGALLSAVSATREPVTLAVDVIRFNDILIYAQAGVAVAIIAVSGIILWFVLNKPRIADFLIATEIEMRKVSWPSRREIIGSTWIVICGTLMMVALLFTVNLGFTWFFQRIGILAGG